MPATKALVLVNTTDSLKLDQTYFTEGHTPSVPTVVIGKSNGEKILEYLRQYGRELQIRIKFSSFEGFLGTGQAREEGARHLEIVKVKEKDTGENEQNLILSPLGKFCTKF